MVRFPLGPLGSLGLNVFDTKGLENFLKDNITLQKKF